MMSVFPDGLYQFGGSPVGPAASVIAAGGKWYWVDTVNGNDAFDGTKPYCAKKTVAAAYALTRSGYNDGVFMVGNATADTITTAITWSNNFCHLIGLTPPTMYGIRNRITSTTATISPMITISGDGCVFQNIMFSHEGSHATTAAICATITGSRNYFGNVTFRKLGALAVVDASKRDVYLNSDDGENYFHKCTFGTDTYDGSANAANFVMEFAASAQTARNVFDQCLWLGSGSSGASWIKTGASSLSSMQWFKDCLFWNNDLGSMNAMTQGFALAADSGGKFIFQNTVYYGAATLETSNSTIIQVENVYAAATTGNLVAATF